MVGQCLSNTNENTTMSNFKKKLHLNKAWASFDNHYTYVFIANSILWPVTCLREHMVTSARVRECFFTCWTRQECPTHFLACKTSLLSNVLLNISASSSSMSTLSISISPFTRWSLMKWWQISVCFILERWTMLVAIFMALSLSYRNDTCSKLIPKSNKVAH